MDAGELARVAAEIRAEGERVALPNADPNADAEDVQHAALDHMERIAEGDKDALKALDDLTEDDLADLFDLGFGLVADMRGKHWELSPRSAKRLGRCFKRTLDRHGWEWAAKWMPDVMSALFLGFEVWKRVARDRELASAVSGKGAA